MAAGNSGRPTRRIFRVKRRDNVGRFDAGVRWETCANIPDRFRRSFHVCQQVDTMPALSEADSRPVGSRISSGTREYRGKFNPALVCSAYQLRELSEESQLMLAELHAALPRLRKAAFQPGASDATIELLHAI